MSHVPLLSRQGVPKLQPTRRGPLVACLCLLAGLACLITPSSTYAHVFENLTRATHTLPVEPPPEAIRRVIEYAKRFPYTSGPDPTFSYLSDSINEDLIHAVAHLAQQEMNPR
jgi:hypothetical protein